MPPRPPDLPNGKGVADVYRAAHRCDTLDCFCREMNMGRERARRVLRKWVGDPADVFNA